MNQPNSDQPMDKSQLAGQLSELLSARIDWKKLTKDELEILHNAFANPAPFVTATLQGMEANEREEVIRPFVAGSPSTTPAPAGRQSVFGGGGGGLLDRLNAAKQRPIMGPILDALGL